MGHSGDFARWPHLGPIRPVARGGHLGPLSYVYGYRGGIGRSGVGQDTNGDDGIEIRARDGRYALILWRCMAHGRFCAQIGHFHDGPMSPMWVNGQRKNGRSVEKISPIPIRDAPGRSYSWHKKWLGVEKFVAVKNWARLIASRRVQLVALYMI